MAIYTRDKHTYIQLYLRKSFSFLLISDTKRKSALEEEEKKKQWKTRPRSQRAYKSFLYSTGAIKLASKRPVQSSNSHRLTKNTPGPMAVMATPDIFITNSQGTGSCGSSLNHRHLMNPEKSIHNQNNRAVHRIFISLRSYEGTIQISL